MYGGKWEHCWWREVESADRKRLEEGKGPSCHCHNADISYLKATETLNAKKKSLPHMRGDEGAERVKSHQFHTEQVVLYWLSHTQTSHCRCAGKKKI